MSDHKRPPEVSRSEFEVRQEQVRDLAFNDLGLDALIVVSRGGGATDMAADVLWMTNHYSQHAYFADHTPMGTGRSHGVVVLAAGQPTVLISDVSWWRIDLVAVDEVRVTIDVARGVLETLSKLGLGRARIGLVGTSHMSAALHNEVVAGMPDAQWSTHDNLVESLRLVKTSAEQAIIRESIRIGSEAVDAVMEAAIAGATEAEATLAGLGIIIPAGALLYDQPTASGPLAHEYMWSRLPSWDASRRMQAGEWFHIDHFGTYRGYLWDLGRSRVVGDDLTGEQRDLLEASIGLVDAMSAVVRPGIPGKEVHAAGMSYLRTTAFGRGIDDSNYPALGHGIGLSWEPPWITADSEDVLETGMFLALEGILADVQIGGAMFEENGIIGPAGYELISTSRRRYLN